MDTGIDILAVVMANLLGIMLLVVISYSNRWRLTDKSRESRALVAMVALSLLSCIVDPIACLCTGQPGFWCFLGVYLGNWWLYLTNLFLAPLWLLFLCWHLNVHVSRGALRAIFAVNLLCLAPLVVNFFTPVVFSVDEFNIYHRGPLYWLYVCAEMAFISISLVIYLYAKHRGGALKAFPIGMFLVPVIVGIVVQSVFYGVSMIWPCVAIAIAGVVAALQNETIYHDGLTGLYSRMYLDYLKRQLISSRKAQFTAIMLDLNGFKGINDTFGHSEGDVALITTGKLLNGVVRTLGVVVRYAGDEFIVLLNTQDDVLVEELSRKVKATFKEYNETSGKGYRLSLAAGISKVNLLNYSVDELMNEIDERMFEDKRRFYESHPECERRAVL